MGTPLVAGDRVLQTTTTTGTGTYQLGAAAAVTYRTLAQAGINTGDRVMFFVQDDPVNPTLWEECEGVYTAGSPDTLTRAQVVGGSNGTSPVNWASGTKYVVVTAFARRLALLDTDGQLPLSVVAAAMAAAGPSAKIVRANTSLAGGPYGLNASAVTLLGLTIPAGTRSFDLFAGMNWLNNHSAPVAVLIAAALRNAADTADQQNAAITRGTQVAGAYGFVWGPWSVTLGAALTEARTLHLRAYTEASGQIAQAHNLFALAICIKE